MATSEREELAEIIDRVFVEEFGCRASHRELYQAVLPQVPKHIINYFASDAIRSKVSSFFTRKRDGLPFAPVVNTNGDHVPFELMDFSEYEFVATRYVRAAEPLMTQARKVASEASDKFGRPVVIDGVNLSEKRKRA